MEEQKLKVGILTDKNISFSVHGKYTCNEQEIPENIVHHVAIEDNRIRFQDKLYDSLSVEASNDAATFCLKDVTIGVAFHWERKNDQYFLGNLQFIAHNNELIAINIVSIEAYLTCVIASEMSAAASLEFLKAHAVISRSWLLAQIEKSKKLTDNKIVQQAIYQTEDTYIRWYDREDHLLFDVCADDHCQRYQGISQVRSLSAKQAVEDTCGQVLVYDGTICDARFSKCCGGMTEEFQHVWEPSEYPYLKAKVDNSDAFEQNLKEEANAEKWIRNAPEAFCNTTDVNILSQVLNDFDQETMDFYRWKVIYTQKELSELIKKRSGFDLGEIVDMIPVERGESGRLIRLKIIGTKQTMTFGKELEIRRTLSESHLYSSAFVVDKKDVENGIPQQFILTGAGWGHGVGLCQIGAAVMGENGYNYVDILTHYFTNASIEKRY